MENFTKLDNLFIDNLMSKVSGNAMKCMIVIYRNTVGWNRKIASISNNDFQVLTGINRSKTISKYIRELEVLGVVKLHKSLGKITKYEVRKVGAESATSGGKCQGQKVPLLPGAESAPTLHYKEKERKEREQPSIPEEAIINFIQHLKVNENVNHPNGFEIAIRKKIMKRDIATMQLFDNWFAPYKEANEFKVFSKENIGKKISVCTKNNETIIGDIFYIDKKSDRIILSVKSGDQIRDIGFENTDRILKCIDAYSLDEGR